VSVTAIMDLPEGSQSLPDGEHLRLYMLRRQPSGTWRISAAGSGP
jgi:hypothetical protein